TDGDGHAAEQRLVDDAVALGEPHVPLLQCPRSGAQRPSVEQAINDDRAEQRAQTRHEDERDGTEDPSESAGAGVPQPHTVREGPEPQENPRAKPRPSEDAKRSASEEPNVSTYVACDNPGNRDDPEGEDEPEPGAGKCAGTDAHQSPDATSPLHAERMA